MRHIHHRRSGFTLRAIGAGTLTRFITSLSLLSTIFVTTVLMEAQPAGAATYVVTYAANTFSTYFVPSATTSLITTVVGGSGGTISGIANGGAGASVTSTISVSPGDELDLYVASSGSTSSGGWGAASGGVGSATGGGGGGASAIYNATTNKWLVVAGGGGGAANSSAHNGGASGQSGVQGIASTADNGGYGASSGSAGSGGGHASGGGCTSVANNGSASSTSTHTPAAGGAADRTTSGATAGGGGAGYGGGGGGCSAGGGGGGASYTAGSSVTYSTASTPTITLSTQPAPNRPTISSATANGDRTATITWSAPTTGTGIPSVSGYAVQYSTTGSAPWTTGCTTSSTTSCQISGLSPATNYYVQVGATNSQGTTYSTSSSFMTVRSDPSTPSISNLPASASENSSFTATIAQATGDGAQSVSASPSNVCTASGLVVTFVGAGTCSLTAQTAQSATYNAASGATQTVTVTSRATTTTITSVSSATYGSATTISVSVSPAAASGTVNVSDGNGRSCVATLSSGSGSCQITEPASGSFTYTAAYVSSGNYDPSTSMAFSNSVTKATLTITAASTTQVYGATPVTPTPSYAGFVNGDSASSLSTQPTCSSSATSSSSVGSYLTSCSGAVSSNYTFTYVTGTATVTKATLFVVPASVTISYGDAAPNYAFTLHTNATNGPVSTAVVNVTPTCASPYRSGADAGIYAITCSGGSDNNYNFTYSAAQLTVSQLPTTLTLSTAYRAYPNPTTITATLSPNTATGTVEVSDGSRSCTVTLVSGSGTCTITEPVAGTFGLSGNYTGATNFAASTTSTSFTVADRSASLSFTSSSASSTYGSSYSVTYSLTPGDTGAVTLQSSDTTICSVSGLVVNFVAGTGSCTLTLNVAADANYDTTSTTQSITVSKASLVVTASDAAQTYGGAVPAITATLSGLVNGDGASAVGAGSACSSGTTSASHVGSYSSFCYGLTSSNYSISYQTGTTSVTPTPLTITASDATQYVGDPAPSISPSYSGFVNGDSPSSLTTAPSCVASTSPSSVPGTYVSSCSGAIDRDYSMSYVNGSVTVFSIAASTPFVSNIPSEPTYGGTFRSVVSSNSDGTPSVTTTTPSVCTVTASGLVTFVSTGSCTLVAHVGTGTVYQAADGDPQTFSVSKALLVVTASNSSQLAGTTPPVVTYTITGYVLGDSSSAISTPPPCTSTVKVTSTAGVYTSFCAGASAVNYAFTYVAGKAALTYNIPSQPVITNLPAVDTFGNAFRPRIATSGDGALFVVSTTPAVCAVDATDLVTYNTTGNCVLVAHVAVGPQFKDGVGVTQTISVQNPITAATITYAVPNWWVGGYQGEVTLTNNALVNVGSPSSPWTFSFVLPTGTAIASIWNATEIVTSTSGGTLITVTADASAPALLPGYSVVVGFTTMGNGNPQQCVMGTSTCSLPAFTQPGIPNPSVGFADLNWWTTGYQGQITLFNNTATNIGSLANTWTLSFVLPSGTQLIKLWGGIAATSPTTGGTLVTVTAPTIEPFIAPNTTWVVGYTTTGTGAPQACLLNGAVCLNPPSAPTNVVAVASNGSATVSWANSSDAGSSSITAYVVTVAGGTQQCSVSGAALSAGTCTLSGLTNGVVYAFSVTAENADGLSSAASDVSNAVTPVGPPSSPPAVSVSVNGDWATVTWSLPTSTGGAAVTGYTVKATPSLPASADCVNTLATSCVMTGMIYGVIYTFTVTATNGAGYASSYSSPSNAVVALVNPDAPTSVHATAGNGRVVVSWTAPTFTGGQPLSGYTVISNLGLQCWAAAPDTSCTFSGLANGQQYTFAVQAVAQNRKTSAFSSVAAAVTPMTTASVVPYVWASEGSGQVTVHWKVPSSNGGSPITSYTVTSSPSVSTPTSCLAVTTTSCVFTGLTNGTAYSFRVTATNGAGTNVASMASAAVTPASANQSAALHILFVKTSTWRAGAQGHFTLSNPTATSIGSRYLPWVFRFKLPSGTSLSSLWGATFTSQVSGGVTTVTVTASAQSPTIPSKKFAVVSLTLRGYGSPFGVGTV